MANNYIRTKIEFEFAFLPNGDKKYVFKELSQSGLPESSNVYVLEKLANLEEFKLYESLFNEVRMTAVSVKCVPYNNNMSRNGNPVVIYADFRDRNALGTPMILNLQKNDFKYMKNFNKKWLVTNKLPEQAAGGNELTFYLFTQAQSTVNTENSPCWTVLVTVYLTFRKNLSL
jgi:hypothetical protein